MNFRQIDCACAVARELSFSKAAKSLYLSQSVVSENVSALEAELGVLLFVRDRRSVSLTPAGEYFCSHMESQRRALEETVKKTREISRRGGVEISVGYDGPMAEVWFGRALRSLCEKHPEAIVHIRKEPVSSLTSLLLDGVLDFVVTHSLEVEGVDQLSFRPLQRSRVCAFVPSGHPLAGGTGSRSRTCRTRSSSSIARWMPTRRPPDPPGSCAAQASASRACATWRTATPSSR